MAANQQRNIKPLPKPVRPMPKKQTRPPQPPQPIDPDDFELPRRVPHNTQQRRPQPRRAELTLLDAFQIFARRMYKKYRPARNAKKRRFKKNGVPFQRIIGITTLGIVCIALIMLILWSATNKNAYAVYLGENTVGNIARAEDISETELQELAVRNLEQALGAKVQVNEQVTLKLAHSAGKNILPDSEVIDRISRGFTYKIAATAIYVEDREITVLKTLEEAESVARQLQAPYVNGDPEKYVSVTFVEDWQYVTKMVDEDELGTAEDALIQLDKKERALQDYVIQKGDMLGTIARKNNTTVEKICADNPGYTSATVLKVGNVIKMETTKPYLSVKTVEETVREEVVPMPVRTVENANEYKTYTKVTQEGKDGIREVTVRITRINGIQTGPDEEISTRNTVEPIERIVEIGTSEAAPQRR